jgi:hypothetical protein
MDAVFKKLNYKNQKELYAINAPESFEVNLKSIGDEATIIKSLTKAKDIEFILVFVTKLSEIDKLVPQFAPKLKGDAVVYMCYPKGSSKKYSCDFNRDTGWQIMGKYDLEGVRMVAIDEDWSALRFRKVEFIKTLTRKFDALSEKGKKKAGQDKKGK